MIDELLVVMDKSGSMKEMGKLLIAVNLISYIRERSSLNIEAFPKIKLFAWADTVGSLDLPVNEMRKISPSGRADLLKFKELLASEFSNGGPLKVILVSDGNFSKTEVKDFCVWLGEQPGIYISAVAVGPDASISSLKKLSNNNVFSPENIAVAIESLVYNINRDVLPPVSDSEIRF